MSRSSRRRLKKRGEILTFHQCRFFLLAIAKAIPTEGVRMMPAMPIQNAIPASSHNQNLGGGNSKTRIEKGMLSILDSRRTVPKPNKKSKTETTKEDAKGCSAMAPTASVNFSNLETTPKESRHLSIFQPYLIFSRSLGIIRNLAVLLGFPGRSQGRFCE